MTNLLRVIKKIRHLPKPPEKIEPLWKKLQAQAQAQEYTQAFWERDKKVVREANFKKAQLIRNHNLEQQRLEREAEEKRKSLITENRMKNLKKARRRLRWLRSKNE